jgi:WD40 repeat protein
MLVRHGGGDIKVWDAESGQLHRELESLDFFEVTALVAFLSPDGQQARLVVGSSEGKLRVYDPEAGSVLHRLQGHKNCITDLACIEPPSAAPHHPRLVSASRDGTAKVWDGETGEWLADLRGPGGGVTSVAVWRGHERIATRRRDGRVKVNDGEALTLLHDLDCPRSEGRVLAFKSAEGPHRLLVPSPTGVQVRLLQ